MSHFDRCPDRWEAERQARHDAESRYQDNGYITSAPHRFDCADAQHSYEHAFRSEMYRQEEERHEAKSRRAHEERVRAEREEEERFYEAQEYERMMAEEEERASPVSEEPRE